MHSADLQLRRARILKVLHEGGIAREHADAGIEIGKVGADRLERGPVNRALAGADLDPLRGESAARRRPVAQVPPQRRRADQRRQQRNRR